MCRILKNRTEICRGAKQNENLSAKRKRVGKDEQVESALKLWFTDVQENDARVDGPLMRQKAEDGWFNRWKKRENIVYKRPHGEQKDADFSAANVWIENEWPKIIEEYAPEDIYNADETGLYYRALPEHTFMFKGENAKGCKTSKERLTVLCCASMSGNKENLLVIGKSKNPRCFKGVKQLPVEYCANSNAWMTTTIFNEWLMKWDEKLKRKIVLLVDNCTAHGVKVSLKNIKVVFLPANTTSLIQPCDQGIIRTLKAYYRREMRARILENMEDKKINANDLAKKTSILDALHLLAMSWKRVSDKTVRNCFSHGGFSKPAHDDAAEEAVERPEDLSEKLFDEWMAIDENIQVAAKLTESDICQTVTQTGGESNDEEDSNIPKCDKPPTASEMRDALQILRLGVQHKAGDFDKLYEFDSFITDLLRKKSRQPTLHEFF